MFMLNILLLGVVPYNNILLRMQESFNSTSILLYIFVGTIYGYWLFIIIQQLCHYRQFKTSLICHNRRIQIFITLYNIIVQKAAPPLAFKHAPSHLQRLCTRVRYCLPFLAWLPRPWPPHGIVLRAAVPHHEKKILL